MIVTYDDHTPRARQRLTDAGIPVIEIWETPSKPIGHVVGFSNRAAACAMTQHLIDIGRRRIGYIGESDDKGTRGAQTAAGVPRCDEIGGAWTRSVACQSCPPPMTMLLGREATLDAIRSVAGYRCHHVCFRSGSLWRTDGLHASRPVRPWGYCNCRLRRFRDFTLCAASNCDRLC